MTGLIPFAFKDALFRGLLIDDAPHFVAPDAARVLGYRDAPNLVRILDDDEKGTHEVSTLGGVQTVLVITESGLYHAIFKSRRPEAVAFRKWVTSVVLPELRRTGRYAMPGLDTRRPVSLNRMTALWDRVAKSTDPAERAFNYAILCRENEYHRLPVPELAAIGTETPPPVDLIARLFDGLDQLTVMGIPWNHSRNAEVDAFVPAEINEKFKEAGIDFVIDNHIREISRLPSSGITKKTVNSALGNRIMHCWVIRSRSQHRFDL